MVIQRGGIEKSIKWPNKEERTPDTVMKKVKHNDTKRGAEALCEREQSEAHH